MTGAAPVEKPVETLAGRPVEMPAGKPVEMPAGMPAELLNAAEPWVVYRTRLDLLGQSEDDAAVRQAKAALLDHPLVRDLAAELQAWPGTVLNSHKSAGQLYHKLAFLADVGLTRDDLDHFGLADSLTRQLADSRSPEGLFRLPMAISPAHGGDGLQQYAWALCDAPLLLYAAARMNLAERGSLDQPVQYLVSLARANGWPCAVSPELGKFRGPGRKDDPCPYPTLIMLKLLTQFPGHQSGTAANAGVACLLDLWQESRTRHPYMFFMGTDFRKLKAPFIWYDILHVADVLSQYPQAWADERFADLLTVIRAKADADGRFTPESEWKAWAAWDFGQKKRPSPWLTFLVWRIISRAEAGMAL